MLRTPEDNLIAHTSDGHIVTIDFRDTLAAVRVLVHDMHEPMRIFPGCDGWCR